MFFFQANRRRDANIHDVQNMHAPNGDPSNSEGSSLTPGARVQAAIEVLDRVLTGDAAERALSQWARGSRYAGSKDRAAVRDHVFDALRMLRSAAWIGGISGDPGKGDGRAVMAGTLAQQDVDLGTVFNGKGHAPAPLEHKTTSLDTAPDAVQLDVPEWLFHKIRTDLKAEADASMEALRHRAPVFLRVNIARTSRDAVMAKLAEEGVDVVVDEDVPTALRVIGTPRGMALLPSFLDGLWEFQDAGSQALVSRVPLTPDARVLDLCAGGGGKALALAARGARVFAHDADSDRMRDLPVRADRAGVQIPSVTHPEAEVPFDLVVADVPCSGSGSWRRAPDAKWRLTQKRLDGLAVIQRDILQRALSLTRPDGHIAYMTCSILSCENENLVDRVLSEQQNSTLVDRWSCLPSDDGPDGFHMSVIRRGR